MKKILPITVLAAVLLSAHCSTIDVAIFPNYDVKNKMKTIAVLPFSVRGSEGLGEDFSASISHYLMKAGHGRFEIVEREKIKSIVQEGELSATGLIDEKTAQKIGGKLGANLIIIGKCEALDIKGKNVHPGKHINTFHIKAINVEKGSMLISIIKEPGRAWDAEYRAKFCLTGGCIWDREDVLIESSLYSDLAKQCVAKLLEAIDQIEKR